MTSRPRPAADGGFLTVEYVAAIGLSLVLFTLLANLVVVQYGRGAVRATLDEAARAGSRTTASAARAVQRCRASAVRARAAYLGGRLDDGIRITCTVRDGRVAATARGTFASWFPGVPDWRVVEVASARRETLP